MRARLGKARSARVGSRAVLVVASSLVAVACRSRVGPGGAPSSAPARASAERPAPAWARVAEALGPQGEVTPQAALRAFSLVYGVALPGVPAMPARDASVPVCGTEATRWVVQHASTYTPEQRAVIERALSGRAGAHAHAAPPARSAGVLSELASLVALREAHADPLPDSERRMAQSIVDELFSQVAAFVGVTPTIRVFVGRDQSRAPADAYPMMTDLETDDPDLHPLTVLSATTPMSSARYCRVRFNAQAMGPHWRNEAFKRFVIGHELFHCLQFQSFRGSYADWGHVAGPVRPWVVEAAAGYVGEALTGGSGIDGYWLEGYMSPSYVADYSQHRPAAIEQGIYDHYNAGYDGVGLYYTLEGFGLRPLQHRGGDGLPDVLGILNEPSSNAALLRLLQGRGEVLRGFATASTRRAWGPEWDLASPYAQREPQHRRTPLLLGHTVAPGRPYTVQLLDGEMQVASLPFANVEYLRVRGAGTGHLVFDQAHDYPYTGPTHQVFCRSWPCACPDGRGVANAVAALPTGVTRLELFHMGIPGSVAATLTVDAPTRDELCGGDAAAPPALDASPNDASEPEGYDPCLEGEWSLAASPGASWLAPIARAGTIRRATGRLRLRFRRGNGRQWADNIQLQYAVGGAMPAAAAITVRMQGGVTGEYRAGQGRMQFRTTSSDLVVTSGVDLGTGFVPVPVPTAGLRLDVLGGAGAYRCTPTTLEYTPPDGAPSVTFTR